MVLSNPCTDIVGGALIPAVEEAARAEADVSFSGHYAFANTSRLNSSMTIKTDDQPGLSVSQWISNGTDFALTSTVLQNGMLSGYLDYSSRLQPFRNSAPRKSPLPTSKYRLTTS